MVASALHCNRMPGTLLSGPTVQSSRLGGFTHQNLSNSLNTIFSVTARPGYGVKNPFSNKSCGFSGELAPQHDIFPDGCFVRPSRDSRTLANSLLKLSCGQRGQELVLLHRFHSRAHVGCRRLPGLEASDVRGGVDDAPFRAQSWKLPIRSVHALRAQLRYFHELKYEEWAAEVHDERAGIPKLGDLNIPGSAVNVSSANGRKMEWLQDKTARGLRHRRSDRRQQACSGTVTSNERLG